MSAAKSVVAPLRLWSRVSLLLPSKVVKHAKVIPVDVLGKEFVELVIRLCLWRPCDSGLCCGPLRVERVNLSPVGKITRPPWRSMAACGF